MPEVTDPASPVTAPTTGTPLTVPVRSEATSFFFKLDVTEPATLSTLPATGATSGRAGTLDMRDVGAARMLEPRARAATEMVMNFISTFGKVKIGV